MFVLAPAHQSPIGGPNVTASVLKVALNSAPQNAPYLPCLWSLSSHSRISSVVFSSRRSSCLKSPEKIAIERLMLQIEGGASPRLRRHWA